jgi:capsular exopolysaccharide synthesis family protein
MEIRDVFATLRAKWWFPPLGAVLGGGAAVLVSLLLTVQYQSSTQFFVSATPAASAPSALQANQLAQERLASYAKLITGPDIARGVLSQLDLPMSAKTLRRKITATTVPDTVLIDVTVTDSSPQRALQIAQMLDTQFTAAVTELETAAGGESPVKVTVTQLPQLPTEPSSPQTVRNGLIGGAVGLVLGAVLALMWRVLRRSVTDPREAAELAGAPVVGVVPRDRTLRKQHVPGRTVGGPYEDFRRIRSNLQFLGVGASPDVLMVTSAVPAEGKSILMLNLAASLAEVGRTVTVVEADLRSPGVAGYLGLAGDTGLAQVLSGEADVDDVVQTYEQGGFSVVVAGEVPPDAPALLESAQMPLLLEQLRGRNDVVLVEGPPLLAVADSAVLARSTNGVLLAVRYDRTRREQLDQAAAVLELAGARIVGVVLTMVPRRDGVAPAHGCRPGEATGRHRSLPARLALPSAAH